MNNYLGENSMRQSVIIEIDTRLYQRMSELSVAMYPSYFNEEYDPNTAVSLAPLGLFLSIMLNRSTDEIRSIVSDILAKDSEHEATHC
jgi:hypothetical protein